MASKNALSALRKALQDRISCGGFERHFSGLQVLSGGDGKCTAKLKLESGHQNVKGYVHGGVTSTLVDTISTIALTSSKSGVPGTSVDLRISFLRQIKIGDTILIEAETVKVGKNLAFLEVHIRNEETGKLVATGQHTKYVG